MSETLVDYFIAHNEPEKATPTKSAYTNFVEYGADVSNLLPLAEEQSQR